MQLELKHLAPYLPYGLKCQYEGIVNGSEISKHLKEFQKESTPFTDWENYEPIEQKKGLKIAPLKTIRVFKKYWVAICGIYHNGQKNFYNGFDIKPILRPLSDLTKEIEVNGVKFVPIDKLKERDSNIEFLGWYQSTFAFILDEKAIGIMAMPYYIIQQLFAWHFDVFGLIENGLAIDINTLNK